MESDTHNVANFVCDLERVIQNDLIKICIVNNVCDVKFFISKATVIQRYILCRHTNIRI